MLRRFWNWLTRKPPAAPAALPERPVMHFAPGVGAYPLCGASIRTLWTVEFGPWVTCRDCQIDGERMLIQWHTNNR
jgi:hypothetical protein